MRIWPNFVPLKHTNLSNFVIRSDFCECFLLKSSRITHFHRLGVSQGNQNRGNMKHEQMLISNKLKKKRS